MSRLYNLKFTRRYPAAVKLARMLTTEPDEDQLSRQRDLLTGRIARHQAMVTAIDRELNASKLGLTLTARERLEVFGSTRLEDNADRASAK